MSNRLAGALIIVTSPLTILGLTIITRLGVDYITKELSGNYQEHTIDVSEWEYPRIPPIKQVGIRIKNLDRENDFLDVSIKMIEMYRIERDERYELNKQKFNIESDNNRIDLKGKTKVYASDDDVFGILKANDGESIEFLFENRKYMPRFRNPTTQDVAGYRLYRPQWEILFDVSGRFSDGEPIKERYYALLTATRLEPIPEQTIDKTSIVLNIRNLEHVKPDDKITAE